MTSNVQEVDRLNSLLRDEVAALADYGEALRPSSEAPSPDTELLGRFAREHRLSIETLKAIIQSLGGRPEETTADRRESARARPEPPSLFGDHVSVGRLLEREQRGLDSYQASLGSLEPPARHVVESELIPRQRKHVVALSAMKFSMRLPG